MDFLIALGALCFLMFVAYRGFSVILFAPVAAMGAVLLTNPADVPAAFSGVFMERMVGFVKDYFPVFLLGAVFGKLIEISGFSKSIVAAVIDMLGDRQAMLSIVLVGAILTYGGVSLFVVVFAVYPFAAEMFRQSNIPKRLVPGTIALGAFSFTMDALPGTPQIQNIIPTTYFKTTAFAAPVLGVLGGIFVLILGITYLEYQRKRAAAAGEGYGEGHINEPVALDHHGSAPWFVALLPLVMVFGLNKWFTILIKESYGAAYDLKLPAMAAPVHISVDKLAAVWAVQGALIAGILAVLFLAWKPVTKGFVDGAKAAVGGALLAAMNTASEYGFGAVIATLPGFIVIRDALGVIPNPLVREAVTVTSLAGITGSASGGMSIALAAMSSQFIEAANAHGIPMEVLHRVAAMASGGMDTLPHNGAVITLLAVCGLTHKQSYKDVFAVTIIKTLAVFFVIGVFYATGWV